MPGCLHCRMLTQGECSAFKKAQEILARPLPPPPLGACMIPIVEEYLPLIKKGMVVLELGCGSWDAIKVHCEKIGAHYEGIDVLTEYYGKKTVATRLENLKDLSYPNDSFDVIIGTQSMEHWPEYGCSLRWGMYQCFRCLKENGLLLLNVPIHFHGVRPFMLGKIEALKKLFEPFSSEVSFHTWGYPSEPLHEYFAHPGYWVLYQKPAYVLDIHAIKNKPLPKGYRNFGIGNVFIAKLLNFPISYLVYRALFMIFKLKS